MTAFADAVEAGFLGGSRRGGSTPIECQILSDG